MAAPHGGDVELLQTQVQSVLDLWSESLSSDAADSESYSEQKLDDETIVKSVGTEESLELSYSRLYTKDDPARDYFGSAKQSHPKEMAEIIERMEKLGVKIVYREGAMSYQPSPVSGKPGQIVIEPEASYYAWKHEEKHALDDYEAGWLGFYYFMDSRKTALLEKAAYDVEIAFAKEHGLDDLVEKLEELKKREMGEYYE